jgi:hypothetical protein
MKILKLATLVAIASLPLMLLGKKQEGKLVEVVESDHIFDEELSSN